MRITLDKYKDLIGTTGTIGKNPITARFFAVPIVEIYRHSNWHHHKKVKGGDPLSKTNHLPVLLAVEDDRGFLKAWCPFCRKYHYHGKNEGHRVAHCKDPNSPFHKTGYVLKIEKGR